MIGGLGGGNIDTAATGAAGAGVSAGFARQLNNLADNVDDATGSKTLGNVTANVLAGLGGAVIGGGAGAAAARNADLYNRQLNPKEHDWAKDNASRFAEFYKEQTGQTLTVDQAQQMLLASGYRLVDAAASAGPAPDGSKYATAFISQNSVACSRLRLRSTTVRSCMATETARARRSRTRCRAQSRILRRV